MRQEKGCGWMIGHIELDFILLFCSSKSTMSSLGASKLHTHVCSAPLIYCTVCYILYSAFVFYQK